MFPQKTKNVIGFFTTLIVFFIFISKVNFNYVRGKEAIIFWGVVIFYFLFAWQYRSHVGRFILIIVTLLLLYLRLIVRLIKKFYNEI